MIFISSQTIVISMAALIAALTSPPLNLLIIPLLLIGVFLIYYWVKITKSRGLDVTYCHMQLEKAESGIDLPENDKEKPFFSFKDWQNKYTSHPCPLNEKIRELKEYDRKYKRNLYDSYTRRIMGEKLPSLYSIMWVVILVVVVISFLFP